jgi:ABC-type sulfate transport system substrate-binding protein
VQSTARAHTWSACEEVTSSFPPRATRSVATKLYLNDAKGDEQDWRKAAPNNAVLATSVVAMVVRQGNPKGIRDWDDLTRWDCPHLEPVQCGLVSAVSSVAADCLTACRDDVETITANPKTAGVARWNFLALWGHRMRKGDAAAQEYVTKVVSLLTLPACLRCG